MNPIQVQVQKYVEYCMGYGYVNKAAYANDLARARSLNTLIQASIDRLMEAERLRQERPMAPPEPSPLPVPIRLVQQAVRWVITPFVPLLTMMQTTVTMALMVALGTAGKTVSVLEQAVSKVLTFFFGFKKTRDDERDKRDKDDFADTDVFTRLVVEASQGSDSQNGQR